MGIELKIQWMAIDGLPYTCPECDSNGFTLNARGAVGAFATVWATCVSYHSWEVFLLDIGDLKLINTVRTGRQRAEDDDTFEIVIGGALLEGVLHPEVILDDLKRAGRDVLWQRVLRPAARRRKNQMKQAIRRPIRAAHRAVTRSVNGSVAAAKAAALETAWDLQAGGHQPDPDYKPEPVNACPFCIDGFIQLDTHLHDTTSVRCTVCSGTGEID